jgi:ribosome-binding protein aMBF1 (putative translation factor)
MPDAVGGGSRRTGFKSEEERLRVMKAHNPVQGLPAREIIKQADAAPTILQRESILRGWSPSKVSEKARLGEGCFEAIASGRRPPEKYEAKGLEKAFGLPCDLLSGKNDAENRAKVAAKRNLI